MACAMQVSFRSVCVSVCRYILCRQADTIDRKGEWPTTTLHSAVVVHWKLHADSWKVSIHRTLWMSDKAGRGGEKIPTSCQDRDRGGTEAGQSVTCYIPHPEYGGNMLRNVNISFKTERWLDWKMHRITKVDLSLQNNENISTCGSAYWAVTTYTLILQVQYLRENLSRASRLPPRKIMSPVPSRKLL